MKTELKTLKDLKGLCYPRKIDMENDDAWIKLKSEAIKWVKFYQKGSKNDEETKQWLRMWIKKFFNLTEEDLK